MQISSTQTRLQLSRSTDDEIYIQDIQKHDYYQGFIKAVFTTAKRYLSPLKKRCKHSPFSERNYLLKQNISNIVCVFVFVRLKFNEHIRIYRPRHSNALKMRKKSMTKLLIDIER